MTKHDLAFSIRRPSEAPKVFLDYSVQNEVSVSNMQHEQPQTLTANEVLFPSHASLYPLPDVPHHG